MVTFTVDDVPDSFVDNFLDETFVLIPSLSLLSKMGGNSQGSLLPTH
jgi:hypothetical protein